MRKLLILTILICASSVTAQPLMGFRVAAGFSLGIFQPDLDPINAQLTSLNMPEINDPVYLYGGQILGQLGEHLRLGIMSFTGSTSVKDLANGYAREANFRMSWSGLQVEYRSPVFYRFEAFGGSSFGFGGVTVRLEKTRNPAGWGEIWEQYVSDTLNVQNLTTELHHSFFLVQPRAGLRYYVREWLILSGSAEIPLLDLNSGRWTVNGNDVYGAPSLDLVSPFFQFSLLVGI